MCIYVLEKVKKIKTPQSIIITAQKRTKAAQKNQI